MAEYLVAGGRPLHGCLTIQGAKNAALPLLAAALLPPESRIARCPRLRDTGAAAGILRSLGRISDFRVDDRRERLLPLLIGTVCYVLCALTFAKIPSAIFLRKFMVAAACCEAMCFVVSLRWKISLHLTGMGAAVALLVVMNVVGVGTMLVPLAVAVLLAGALASARLYLGCHNGAQVLAGFGGGFVVTLLAVLFL